MDPLHSNLHLFKINGSDRGENKKGYRSLLLGVEKRDTREKGVMKVGFRISPIHSAAHARSHLMLRSQCIHYSDSSHPADFTTSNQHIHAIKNTKGEKRRL